MAAPLYFITTYGCQMNKHDSERIAGILASMGFVETADESKADILIVNSCSVRQSAEERIYGSQEKYLEYKKNKPDMIVAVTGCLPGRDKKKEFRSRLPGTDLYFATADMIHLPRWISELRPDLFASALPLRRGDTEGSGLDPNPDFVPCDYLHIHPLRVPSAQAFVTIQTGCNKFCSYCVVPHARGLEKNRPLADILEECRALVDRGVVEITLLGQSVNSYLAVDPTSFSKNNPFCHSSESWNPSDDRMDSCFHRNDNNFAALLWELNQLPGLHRLHWTAAHPLSMTDEVIEAMKLPKQVNYLHLPVQSGNNEVLRRMNRKYTREQFLDVIRKVKEARPGIALGTDIIVGFSGETRAQFEDTLSLYREVDFDISYHAQYSVRSGTLAAKIYQDDVPEEEKRRRWNEIQDLMEKTVLRKNQIFKDRIVSVLVDRVENGYAAGNSNEMKRVRFPSADANLSGRIVSVRVTDPKAWILEGLLES